uniref:RSPH3 protein n=1 Tax=Junco hyemalis TaxID=40217 RepID=A0A8C5JP38_JUNHY
MAPRRECRCPAGRCPAAFRAFPRAQLPSPLGLSPAGRGKPQAALCVLCRREKVRYGNIMVDPRVVRGNVLSSRPTPPQLFDFDIEVKPILEVLVGKTVEQALLEVMEEEELSQLWSHQRAFAELRSAEFAELQRLEEQDRRIREEKERRRLEHLEKLRKQKETAEKIAARAFAQRYLADLIPSVFNNLHDSGFFYDPIERGLFCFFLFKYVTLIRTVVEQRLDEFSRPPPPAPPAPPAEEPGETDAAPKMSGEEDDADQPVAEEEETDQPEEGAEEEP